MINIETSEGLVEFPVGELVSIVYTKESEIKNWLLRAGFSLDARSGNTDQQSFSGNATLRRDGPFIRWTNRYIGTLTEVDGDKTAEDHRVTTELDLLVTQRFFVRVPTFEYYTDEFQNIESRLTPGISLGYQIADTRITEWVITGGAAAQYTEYRNGGSDLNGAILFTSTLAFDFPGNVDLDLAYSLQLVPLDLGLTSHETRAILSYELWDPIDLDLGFYWDRIESPQEEDDGSTPEQDDLRFTVGLALDF